MRPVFAEIALTRDVFDWKDLRPSQQGIRARQLFDLIRIVRNEAILGMPEGYQWYSEVEKLIQANQAEEMDPEVIKYCQRLLPELERVSWLMRPRAAPGPVPVVDWAKTIQALTEQRPFTGAWGTTEEAEKFKPHIKDLYDQAPDDVQATKQEFDLNSVDPYAPAATFLSTSDVLRVIDKYLIKQIEKERNNDLNRRALKNLGMHALATRSVHKKLSAVDFHGFVYEENDPRPSAKNFMPGFKRVLTDSKKFRSLNKKLREPFHHTEAVIKVRLWRNKANKNLPSDGIFDRFHMHSRYVLGSYLGIGLPDGTDNVDGGHNMFPLSPGKVAEHLMRVSDASDRLERVMEWEINSSNEPVNGWWHEDLKDEFPDLYSGLFALKNEFPEFYSGLSSVA
ncbi:MAG: hypothetical protein CMM12_01690 [Rhodospirillaceae bacterium]|nr:hypothetical protein [Rhodospirillaceae bacterium]|tara:strand:+ start:277 stop:1461 length:1185 start_codon:yes stop_codon:yes gene_type:complete